MYLIGYDVGSSSVKASIIDINTGRAIASAFNPKKEMKITANQTGWAEQNPETWWSNIKLSTSEVLQVAEIDASNIRAIGISYQMHGLVLVDKNMELLRSSIIWCDSRAVNIGEMALGQIGKDRCLSHLLNSPGNFTASKLRWVIENEPEIFDKAYKLMLPGDYIAMKMTGELNTTISGLSEGIFWDFNNNTLADFLLDHYGIPQNIIPDIVPTFSEQGRLNAAAAEELGLLKGTPVSYRAGDQPNNAFSLNVLNPGEIAATAGTSGVVYGVSDEIKYDPESRVNTFAHVNHSPEINRLGVLLCINGTGIQYSWLKKNIAAPETNYPALNDMASKVPEGSEGLLTLPFGNGAERMLNNKDIGASIHRLNFNIHQEEHLVRAAQEGIVYAFHYGMEIIKQTGIDPKVIRAGNANMFLSPVFRETLATLTGATIELYDTDGSEGSAKGAGVGSGAYGSFDEAFGGLKQRMVIEPDHNKSGFFHDLYGQWRKTLEQIIG
ncbi:MAG TPA: FGGY family carbohydrate kinase [Bacteroidales bacterium]|nr:FGGY family carbohydrate kinase [Bacteroidales bacterium]